MHNDQWIEKTHENQGGIKIVVVLLHVLSIILNGLSPVHCVEVELGVVFLDGLEVHPQGLLDTV